MIHIDNKSRPILDVYLRDTAVRRIREWRTHELAKTQLTVIPVELDHVGDGDICRTFSTECAPGDSTMSMSCLLHNYLVKVGVLHARLEPDEANRRIVVVVTSYEGMTTRCGCGTCTAVPATACLGGKMYALLTPSRRSFLLNNAIVFVTVMLGTL